MGDGTDGVECSRCNRRTAWVRVCAECRGLFCPQCIDYLLRDWASGDEGRLVCRNCQERQERTRREGVVGT